MELTLLVLKTKQVEKVKAFYEMLGLSFKEEKHGNGPLHYSSPVGKLVLEIYPLPKSMDSADTTTRLGFKIKELDKVFKSLKEISCDVVSAPARGEWGYSAVVKDPDGRSVEISEEKQD